MRSLLLLLALASSPVVAQSPLFPREGGTFPITQAASPHWRVGLSAGISLTFEGTASLDVTRSWRGPFSLGGRAWTMSGDLGVDDGGSIGGGGVEALAYVSTRTRVIDLRAGVGAGVAVLDYSPGGLGCYPEEGFCDDRGDSFEGVAVYAPITAGLDLYPAPGVGVGGELRLALMQKPANVSSVEVGLRLRLAR